MNGPNGFSWVNEFFRKLLNLPPQATELAKDVDMLHYVVVGTTMLGAFATLAFMVAFLVRFRKGRVGETTRRVSRSGAW